MEQKEQTAVVPADGNRAVVANGQQIGYFSAVSHGYRFAFRVLLIVLVLFLVLFTGFFHRAFTYRNLFYFFRDFSGLAGAKENYSCVTYTYHEGETGIVAFHGGLARVSTAGVEIFGADGTRSLMDERRFSAPRVTVSRKYVIAYDHAGTEFYIYNSYDRLFHGTSDYPILGVFPSDSGAFALLTTSGVALSAVTLYDSRFLPVQRFERALATTGVSVSKNGKKLALFGLKIENGVDVSVLDLYEAGAAEPFASFSAEREFPLAVEFLNAGHLFLATFDYVRFLNAEGKTISEFAFEGRELIAADIAGEDGVAIALSTGEFSAPAEILVFDRKGNERLRQKCSADVRDLALSAGAVFVLTDGAVRRLPFSGKDAAFPVSLDVESIFAVDENRVAAVRGAMTEYLSFPAVGE